jgi:hypothetical protein
MGVLRKELRHVFSRECRTSPEARNLSTPVENHERRDLRSGCVITWIAVAIALVTTAWFSFQPDHERDFVYFYSVGQILHERPADQLYDRAVQFQFYERVRPGHGNVYGPSPYPPFVALGFRFLAALPFLTAYHLFMIISLSLYSIGLWVLIRTFMPPDPLYRCTWLGGALLFWPFLGRTLASGQLASLGFFSMALAISAQKRQRGYLAGLALSICLYKPTLIIWIIPLLVVSAEWKAIVGFSAGALALISSTTTVLGFAVWQHYMVMIRQLGQWQPYLIPSVYLEVFEVFAVVSRGHSSYIASRICFLGGAAVIGYIWYRILRGSSEHRVTVAWSMTLPLTLLFNVYTPIYDSVLLIVSLTASAHLLRRLPGPTLVRGYFVVLVASYSTTWIADLLHIQIFSFVIAGVIWREMGLFISSRLLCCPDTRNSSLRLPVCNPAVIPSSASVPRETARRCC